MFAPASSHVLEAAFSVKLAPFEFVNVKSTCSPAAATKPFPSPVSFISVTVNVCGWPISFVAFGAIAIFAFTQRFVATPELPLIESLCRVSVRPATATATWALTTFTPVVLERTLTVQEPVPPEITQ